MSDVFKELAIEVGSTKVHQVWFTRGELVKFGKLVVKECSKIATEIAPGDTMEIEEALEKHFGVKL